MIQDNYILKILNFQDDSLEITKLDVKKDCIEIFAGLRIVTKCSCKYCQFSHVHIHSHRDRLIKHSPIGSKRCFIHFDQIRFFCPNCKRSFNVQCPIAEKGRRISYDLASTILKKTSKKISFKDVAEESNISITSTITEFKKNIHEYRCSLTETICIDEFRANTIAGTYALIIGDPVSGVILDILPSRKQDYINHYFNSISKEETDKVKYVVTNLYEAYRTIIKGWFPQALLIADRFHWIRQSTEAFNALRI